MQVNHLECSRGARPLFSGLYFSLAAGELLWVTGRNGSGKTTLLRTLCGLLVQTQGSIHWKHQEPHQMGDDFHQDVLYIGHLNGIKHELTVLENIEHGLALSGLSFTVEEIKQAIKKVGLSNQLHKPCRQLSQGQNRRGTLS